MIDVIGAISLTVLAVAGPAAVILASPLARARGPVSSGVGVAR